MPKQEYKRDYSKFDQMSTEVLEEILRLDAELPDEDSDMDAILYILEVLVKREREHPTGKILDVDTAWASFKKNYLPYAGDGKSLYEEDDPEIPLQGDSDQTNLADSGQRRPKGKNRIFLRVACMAAVFAVLFFGGTITSYAFGYDLWGAFAHWTRETFGFAYVTPTDHPKSYSSLQDALSDYGITEPLTPTWIPDGYTLQSVDISETPIKTKFLAVYRNNNKELTICVKEVSNGDTSIYEKDGEVVAIYEVDSIKHYIMTNNGWRNAAWVNKAYECLISGELPEEIITRMIDSIYER